VLSATSCALDSAAIPLVIRQFEGLQGYKSILEKMRTFTLERESDTADELWLLEHTPVFTQGQAGKPEHIISPNDITSHHIPIIQSDRGGQITYHGPGQIMIYVLLNLARRNIQVHDLMKILDTMLITLLKQYDIIAHTQAGAPGIYVQDAKIASIGLRVRKHCSYHGICLNVDGNLDPFSYIHPCGYKNLKMTQMKDHDIHIALSDVYRSLTVLLPQFLS